MVSKKVRKSLAMFFGIAMIGILAIPVKVAATTELTYNLWIPRVGVAYEENVKPWVAEIEKKTNGRIKFVIPPASLGPPPRSYDLVTSGVADVAFMAMLYKRNEWRLPMISEIPFSGGKNGEAISAAFWRTYKKYFENVGEFKGVKVLTMWVLPESVLLSRKHPITTINDLQKLKVRTEPGAQVEMFKALGVPVVAAQGMKSFELISKGTVDVTTMPYFAAELLKVSNYVKHATMLEGGYYRAAFVLFMNQRVFDSLSPADQKVILEASGEKHTRRISRAYHNEGVEIQKKWKARGIKIQTASPEFINHFKENVQFVEKKWLEQAKTRGVDGRAALNYYKRTITQLENEL